MAHLAIRGHATRGKEVIEILEMLGGKNDNHCCGGFINRIYFINENGYIESSDKMHHLDYFQLSLEEFLKKFPNKVGDKVYNIIHNENQTITALAWDFKENEVVYQTSNNEYVYVNYLQPHKEEPMEEKEQMIINIPNGYEFFGINDENKVVLTKTQPQYPKTYEECCELLDIESEWHLTFELNNSASCGLWINKEFEYICKLEAFRKLLICRDAYWKIAGDWKFYFGKPCYYLCNEYGSIYKFDGTIDCGAILTFPTKEMRDTFYENFKELIETCKEFL